MSFDKYRCKMYRGWDVRVLLDFVWGSLGFVCG